MEAADDYRESQCHCLNSCLDSVNVAMNRNSNIRFTGTLMKTTIKRLLFTSIMILFAIVYHLPLLPSKPVIVTVYFIFCATIIIFILAIDSSKWFNYIVAYVVTINHRYYITVGTLAGVCVGFMNFLLQLIPNSLQEQSEPSHQQAQSTLNNQQVMASVKAMQLDYSDRTVFMSVILGAMLVSAIRHHSNQNSKLTGIISFLMVLFYWQSLSMTFLLAGMFWSIIYAMSGRVIKCLLFLTAIIFLYSATLLVVSGIGSRLFGVYGGHLMQFIGAGIGGGIVALYSSKFASSINIPFIDDYMSESMECFNENIQDLELIKKGINDALHKALTLKHQLIGT